MTDLTIPLPPVPERSKPDLAKAHVDTVVEILNSTTVSRFAAEEELAHRGLDGVFAVFVARLVDNLLAWTASGDWADRRRTAVELVAELVDEDEFDLNNPADARLLAQALAEKPSVEPERDVFDQAGLGVMREMIDIVRDREATPEERLDRLDVETVTYLYDTFVGPAVDGIEAHLGGTVPRP